MLSKEEILKRDLRMIKKANPWVKGFDDLVFIPHRMTIGLEDTIKKIGDSEILREMLGAKQSGIKFEDGGWISVLFGESFYSNGIDTYEFYSSKIENPIGYIKKEEVDICMYEYQLESPKTLLIESLKISKLQSYPFALD